MIAHIGNYEELESGENRKGLHAVGEVWFVVDFDRGKDRPDRLVQ